MKLAAATVAIGLVFCAGAQASAQADVVLIERGLAVAAANGLMFFEDAANDRAIARKSVIAVVGECSAATPAAFGSTSRSSSPFNQRRPGTPFAVARRSSSRSAVTSDASSATTSLPHSRSGRPRSAQ